MVQSGLDLDEDAGWHDEAVQGLDGAMVWLGDVDDPLVRANFELFTRLLVDEGRTVDRVDLAASREGHRARNTCAGTFRVIYDLASRGVESLMVIGFHTNSNLAAGHTVCVSE